MRDQDIIDSIKAGGRELEKTVVWIVKKSDWPEAVTKLVKAYQVEHQIEPFDVFSDSYFTLEQKIIQNSFEQRSSLRTFFIGIARNTLLRHIRNLNMTPALVGLHDSPDLEELLVDDEEQKIFPKEVTISNFMALIPERCKLILLFDACGYKQTEIAEELGYGSGSSAANAVQTCKDALRTEIKKYLNL